MEFNAPVHIVTEFGRPVRVKPELGETEPSHADMLRYDQAFCNPADLSQVVFPVFTYPKTGRSSDRITTGRWSSFSMKVTPQVDASRRHIDTYQDYGQWFTYVHTTPDYKLRKITLAEFVRENNCKVANRWRSL